VKVAETLTPLLGMVNWQGLLCFGEEGETRTRAKTRIKYSRILSLNLPSPPSKFSQKKKEKN
jgi:hypothetical protein